MREPRTPAAGAVPASARPRSDPIAALIAEIEALGSALGSAFVDLWLVEAVVRWRRADPASRQGQALMIFAEGGPWLLVPLVLTAASGQWDDAPIVPWFVIALARGLSTPLVLPMTVNGWKRSLALERTVSNEDDLRSLIASMHRWFRKRVSVPFAIVVVALGLLVVGLVSPVGSIRGLHPGSAAILAMVLYDTGQAAFMALLFVAWSPQRSRFTYSLPWHSPLDSDPVRDFLRGTTRDEAGRGLWVTSLIVYAVVLLGLDSPLTVPAAGFITAVGYAAAIAEGFTIRMLVRHIVFRLKEAQLASLRQRIGAFGPSLSELRGSELAHVKSLAELYDLIGRTPTRLGTTDTLTRVAVSVALPTLSFVATVVGEWYAGQLLDQVVP